MKKILILLLICLLVVGCRKTVEQQEEELTLNTPQPESVTTTNSPTAEPDTEVDDHIENDPITDDSVLVLTGDCRELEIDSKIKKIILDNAKVRLNTSMEFSHDMEFEFKGNNLLYCKDGIKSTKDIKLTGDGQVEIRAYSVIIKCKKLTSTGGQITISCLGETAAIDVETLEVIDGDIKLYSDSTMTAKDVIVKGGKLSASAIFNCFDVDNFNVHSGGEVYLEYMESDCPAIVCKNISVTGGKLSVDGWHVATFSGKGEFTEGEILLNYEPVEILENYVPTTPNPNIIVDE